MTTTIKVSDDLRDRLKEQAARDGVTLGAHLSRLADLDDRDHRLSAFRVAVASTPEQELSNYRVETEAWETAELLDAQK